MTGNASETLLLEFVFRELLVFSFSYPLTDLTGRERGTGYVS